MIYDKLERLPLYKGLNANLDKAIDYVLSHDFSSYVPGKNPVDGDACFISNNVAELSPVPAKYERHMAYIDLQVPIDEGEIINVRPVEDMTWPEDDRETRFTEGPDGIALDMTPGCFAIFFPGDAHRCGLSKSGQTQIRKLVGKAKA